MRTYHRDIGFPAGIPVPAGRCRLKPTRHAITAASTDRYGRINIPAEIRIEPNDVIEMSVENGRVEKILLRIAYDYKRDLCIVVTRNGTVKTVWFNLVSDGHATLDASRYAKP